MEAQESSEHVEFFGMVVKGGEGVQYLVDADNVQQEICHLTNCALASESSSKKPIFVRLRSVDHDQDFVIGALVPGSCYNFTTDLLISPDTVFSHSGRPDDEIHLTGYKQIYTDEMELDSYEGDPDYDESDSEDRDFIDDDEEDDEEDEDNEDEEADEEDEDMPGVKPAGRELAAQKEFSIIEQQKEQARKEYLQLQSRGLIGEKGGLGMDDYDSSDEDAAEDHDEDDEEEDAGPDEAEMQRHINELAALDEDGDGDDEDEDEGDSMDVDDDDDDDADDDDDNGDEEADPSVKAEAVMKARKQQEKIEREKQKQKLNGQLAATGQGRGADIQGTSKRKASVPEAGAPVKKHKEEVGGSKARGHPPHPNSKLNEPSKKFAEDVFEALLEHQTPVQLPHLVKAVPRPEGADKIGKLLGQYKTWFKRDRSKNMDVVSIADKL